MCRVSGLILQRKNMCKTDQIICNKKRMVFVPKSPSLSGALAFLRRPCIITARPLPTKVFGTLGTLDSASDADLVLKYSLSLLVLVFVLFTFLSPMPTKVKCYTFYIGILAKRWYYGTYLLL